MDHRPAVNQANTRPTHCASFSKQHTLTSVFHKPAPATHGNKERERKRDGRQADPAQQHASIFTQTSRERERDYSFTLTSCNLNINTPRRTRQCHLLAGGLTAFRLDLFSSLACILILFSQCSDWLNPFLSPHQMTSSINMYVLVDTIPSLDMGTLETESAFLSVFKPVEKACIL
jgi:hypothetical protein